MLYLLLIPALAYVQEQYLMEIYNQVNSIKESISQLEYYSALEKLEWKSRQDREFEEEGMAIYLEHYADVSEKWLLLDPQITQAENKFRKKEKDSLELFIHETYLKVANLLKRLIIEKDKLIETDIRELAKLKHQTREDTQKRFQEYNFYLKNQRRQKWTIKQLAVDSPNIQDLLKTLELLESKIMIGLFKSNPSQELDFFIKGQPFEFKNEALQLLSLMHSVIQETIIEMMNEQLESSFDLLDKELFYSQSKSTHQQAKESLTTLLNKLEVTGANFWNEQLKLIGDEDHLIQILQSSLDQSMLMSNRSIQYHQQLSDTLRAMLDRFLQR